MRKKIVIGNWKMNKTNKESKLYLKLLEKQIKHIDVMCGIACSPTLLYTAKKHSKNTIICAQNCHFENCGAFTGEVSIPMLNELNVDYVIVGHSERREYFNETDETVNKKVLALISNKMVPILCCGENLQVYENKNTLDFIKNQLKIALNGVCEQDLPSIIIAYEPIWAIGTGKTATVDIAQKVIKKIRNYLDELYSSNISEHVNILYGGSVKPENIKDLLSQEDIDGVLVGGASLDLNDFVKLIKYNE